MNFLNALFNSNVDFVRLSLMTGIAASFPMGIIGSIVSVKRITYIAGAVSHAALCGIGIVVFLNNKTGYHIMSPFAGAVISSILSGVIISLVSIISKERSDTIIGIIWSVGMAIGLLFIYMTPLYIDPMSYLFGNIQLTTFNDLLLVLILSVIVIIFAVFFYNQFLLVSYDSEFAKMRGLNVIFYEVFIVILISLTIVLILNTVGIVLVIALFTIPAGIASMWTDRLWKMMILSSIICMLIIITGMFLSFELSLPSGSIIILIGGLYYFSSMLLRKILSEAERRRINE